MPDYLQHAIELINGLPTWARLAIIAGAAAIEYILPMLPGDTVIVMAGFLYAFGGSNIILVSFAVIVGTLAGSWASYSIGQAIARGRAPIKSSWLPSPETIDNFSRWYKRWGYWLIVINRFFPGIRSCFFLAAGMINLPKLPVLSLGVLSALIFSACLFGLGLFVGNNSEAMLGFLENYTRVFVILGVIIFIFILIIWLYYRRRAK